MTDSRRLVTRRRKVRQGVGKKSLYRSSGVLRSAIHTTSAHGLPATANRNQFLDPLIDDLKLTLLARNRYLGRLDSDRPDA